MSILEILFHHGKFTLHLLQCASVQYLWKLLAWLVGDDLNNMGYFEQV